MNTPPADLRPAQITRRYAMDHLLRSEPQTVAAMLYRLAGAITKNHHLRLAGKDPADLCPDDALLAALMDGSRPVATMPDEAVVDALLRQLPMADSEGSGGKPLVTAGAWAGVKDALKEMVAKAGCRSKAGTPPAQAKPTGPTKPRGKRPVKPSK